MATNAGYRARLQSIADDGHTPSDHSPLNQLTVVIVSPRSLDALSLALLPAAVLHTPEQVRQEPGRPDVFLVDVRDGPQERLVTQLAMGGQQPVVVLGDTGGPDTVAYLDAGASDYISHSIPGSELAARLRAAARRGGAPRAPRGSDAIPLGDDVSISILRHQVRKGGALVTLTPHEFALLQTLLEARGQVVSHRRLMLGVWGVTNNANRHSLRIYIRQLRRKLERDPAAPQLIVTERGRGYRLCADVARG